MFISISQSYSGYSFDIGDSDLEDPRSFFSSKRDHHLFPLCSKTYPSFGEAYRCAQKMIENIPTCILSKRFSFYKNAVGESGMEETDLSVEEQIIEHYGIQIGLIEKRLLDVNKKKDIPDKKELEAVNNEIDFVMSGIKKTVKEIDFEQANKDSIIDIYISCKKLKNKANKLSKLLPQDTKLASIALNSNEVNVKDILMTFGESVLLTFNKKNPDLYIKELGKDSSSGNYHIVLGSPDENVLDLVFNDNLLLSGIMSFGNDRTYDKKFFDEYWLPAVWSVGHIYFPDKKIVACAKNLYRNNDEIMLNGFHVDSNEEKILKCSFGDESGKIQKSWWISFSGLEKKAFLTDVKKDKMVGKEVKCIDRNLPTYYNRTGSIESFSVGDDYADVVVDFRRGLGKVVLRDNQLEGFNLA